MARGNRFRCYEAKKTSKRCSCKHSQKMLFKMQLNLTGYSAFYALLLENK